MAPGRRWWWRVLLGHGNGRTILEMVTLTATPPAPHPAGRPAPRCHGDTLFASRDVAVTTVECEAGGCTELRVFEPDEDAIVLVRTGRFGRRLHGSFSLLDSTQAYLHHKGQEELIQHLAHVGHRCTVLSLRSAGFPTALRLRSRLAHTELRTTPTTDLAHRVLLAQCRRGGDPAAVTAMARTLADDLLSGWTRSSPASHRTGTAAATRRVVDIARESVDSLVAPPSLAIGRRGRQCVAPAVGARLQGNHRADAGSVPESHSRPARAGEARSGRTRPEPPRARPGLLRPLPLFANHHR